MASGTALRRATLDETGRLAQLYVASRLESGEPETRRTLDVSVVQRWLRKSVIHSEVWVLEQVDADDDDRPNPTVAGVLALSDGDIEVLDVDPRLRRLGYGDLLLTHAKARRPSGLRARVPNGQHTTHDFLVRHGFTPYAASDSLWEDLVWTSDSENV